MRWLIAKNTPGRLAATTVLVLALASFLVIRSPARSGAAGRAHAAAAASLRIGGPTSAPPIPAGFTGVSFELTALETYAGNTPGALNPIFMKLVDGIAEGGRPVVRIGGDSTDWSWYPVPGMARPPWVRYTLTPTWLQVAHAVATGLDAKLIVGVNFEANSAKIAGTEAKAMVNGIGAKNLAGLELGNEPELYSAFNWYRTANGVAVKGRQQPWEPNIYDQQYKVVAKAMPAAVPLAGPAVGSAKWSAPLASFLAGEPRVKIATLHRYPTQRCAKTTVVTAATLLSKASSDGLAATVAPFVRTARQRGRQLRIDEMNAVSCGGEPGLSNTFATSLWAPDAMFALAKAGVSGVNIHTTPNYVNQLFTFAQATDGGWSGTVEPLYYGLLMFNKAAPAGSKILQVKGSADDALRVWATRDPDKVVRVLAINTSSSGPRTISLTVPGQTDPGSLIRMRAPRLTATAGVSIGGASFGDKTTSGVLPDTHGTSVTRANGKYTIVIPKDSAALLTLGGASSQPTGPTGPYGIKS